jgi:3-methyladenine DNA glycosylase AlkD
LKDEGREMLKSLATSDNIWERRTAIIATFAFIRQGEVKDTLDIAKILLPDPHDLIYKAVGWALREVGKVDRLQLLRFLQKQYRTIPRTTFRYAIERFTPKERKQLLSGKFDLEQ